MTAPKTVCRFCIALILTSCLAQRPMKNMLFDKEGHRGCRGLMPENTIPAMLKAVDLGVTTLEMDAVITADGKVVLSHKPFFNHEISTRPDGSFLTEKQERALNIYKMTYDEVRTYDVGLKPHPRFPKQQKLAVHKPLLVTVIDSVERYCRERGLPMYYNIETKTRPATDNIYHPAPASFVDILMTVINERNISNRVIIQSFDFRTLQYLHKRYPAVATAMLIEGSDQRTFDQQLDDLGFTPTIYSPAYALVTQQVVDACHHRKIRVIPWTVNTQKEIERLQAMGIDGIITDYPDLFSTGN